MKTLRNFFKFLFISVNFLPFSNNTYTQEADSIHAVGNEIILETYVNKNEPCRVEFRGAKGTIIYLEGFLRRHENAGVVQLLHYNQWTKQFDTMDIPEQSLISINPSLGDNLKGDYGDRQVIKENSFWIDGTIGGGAIPRIGVTRSFSLNGRIQSHFLTLKYTTARGESFDQVDGEFWSSFKPSSTEIALMYGRGTRENNSLVSISAGISFLSGTRRGPYVKTIPGGHIWTPWGRINSDDIDCYESRGYSSAIGIPIELQIAWTKVLAGVGLKFIGNFNKQRSFGGIQLSLLLGYL